MNSANLALVEPVSHVLAWAATVLFDCSCTLWRYIPDTGDCEDAEDNLRTAVDLLDRGYHADAFVLISGASMEHSIYHGIRTEDDRFSIADVERTLAALVTVDDLREVDRALDAVRRAIAEQRAEGLRGAPIAAKEAAHA